MTEKFKGRAAHECAIGDEPFTFGPYELGGQTIRISARAMAAEVWSRLVKAGLAEEQREPGFYWGKPFGRWCVLEFTGEKWTTDGVEWWGPAEPCSIIGPRIEPPKD